MKTSIRANLAGPFEGKGLTYQNWKPEYLDGDKLKKPNLFRDWRWGLKNVWSGARSLPVHTTVLVVLTLTKVFDFGMLIDTSFLIAKLVFMQFVVWAVITASWNELLSTTSSGAERPEQTPEPENNKASKTTLTAAARLMETSIYYAVGTVLRLFLLVIPGIRYATRRCLAPVFVCVEKREANDALRASNELIKKNFWQVFFYALVAPIVMIFVGTFLFKFLMRITPLFLGEGETLVVQAIGQGVLLLVSTILQLSVTPLLVYMYSYLKDQESGIQASAPQ